jgi:2-C-methyl-D-erythritol 4-phosphate cytidylyltransferase / 2-C-methyl-D-erythritol 2,4-cyclodiphosphate synthase
MRTVALIVAAGRGVRAAALGQGPKQYVSLRGKPILARTLEAMGSHPGIDSLQVVIHPEDSEAYSEAIAIVQGEVAAKLREPVPGGATRQMSALAGLEALAGLGYERVLIHDAARPLISAADIDAVLAALDKHGAALLAVPVSDTLKRAKDDSSQTVGATVPRNGLWQALTPQGFAFADILEAHRASARSGRDDFTDDASIAEAAGIEVVLVEGRRDNIKITAAEDFELSERLMRTVIPDVRTGNGFDVHRFAEGRAVWLCGVEIPHSHCLEGHSDADVGLHALTDALLGALGAGDIGQHFPPSDEQWRGAASDQFLAYAMGLVVKAGGTLTHADVTLICEAPKIGPHRDRMRARVAEILGIQVARVSVKATTSERLGFTGRKEGIAAMATATVVFPSHS